MPWVGDPVIVGIGAGPTSPVSIIYVSSGMAGSGLSPADTGIYSFPSTIGVGVAGTPNRAIQFGGSLTAVASIARMIGGASTMVASANNDTLYIYSPSAVLTPGAFTGVGFVAHNIAPQSVAAFVSPADPVMVNIGVLTGTGATNAFGIRIAPPAGATNNYLISHSTPATFNVLATGVVTLPTNAVSLVTNGGATNVMFTSAANIQICSGSTGFQVTNQANNASLFSISNAGAVTVPTGGSFTLGAGVILKLGNARNAGIVAQGGTVTMQDSTGATIQVLVA